jgi:hypothetical protein
VDRGTRQRLQSVKSLVSVGVEMAALRERLEKHKIGTSCFYVNTLADVDVDVLREMITLDFAWMNARYPA